MRSSTGRWRWPGEISIRRNATDKNEHFWSSWASCGIQQHIEWILPQHIPTHMELRHYLKQFVELDLGIVVLKLNHNKIMVEWYVIYIIYIYNICIFQYEWLVHCRMCMILCLNHCLRICATHLNMAVWHQFHWPYQSRGYKCTYWECPLLRCCLWDRQHTLPRKGECTHSPHRLHECI